MVSVVSDSVGVTGHQDLPEGARSLLVQRLREWFPSPDRVEVVCSLAVGADSIVAQHLTSQGARLHAVIPCQNYASTFTSERDLSLYRHLLASADAVEVLGFDDPSEEAFMAAGSLVVRSSDWLIAVWDGKGSRGLGGTGDVVALARSLDKPVRIVWPGGLSR